MDSKNKSRNAVGVMPIKSMINTTVSGRSILLPSVPISTKVTKSSFSNTKSPYERSALTPPNRTRPSYNDKPRPTSNKTASSSAVNFLKKKQDVSNK